MLGNNHKLDGPITPTNKANYSALCVLEKLGLDAPSQQQINIIETLILFAMKPKLIPFKLIEYCVGDDSIASDILSEHLRNS